MFRDLRADEQAVLKKTNSLSYNFFDERIFYAPDRGASSSREERFSVFIE
jgi:hypothetical protein